MSTAAKIGLGVGAAVAIVVVGLLSAFGFMGHTLLTLARGAFGG